MYARSNSMTLTVAEERFAFPTPVMARSTQPEVFTFERIPTPTTAVRSYVPIRPKRRCTRVMYPAKVRMHLPAPERSQAKRWLVILCLVVLWQIYTEEPCAEAPPSADCSITSPSRTPPPPVLSANVAENIRRAVTCPTKRRQFHLAIDAVEKYLAPHLLQAVSGKRIHTVNQTRTTTALI
uniref:Uncharacterized protein n=1 Tax=Fundulus heteroclitus TaxID=8078 RepID=A0A3Q2Q1M2_FUNHE